jgi:hypothetical protein
MSAFTRRELEFVVMYVGLKTLDGIGFRTGAFLETAADSSMKRTGALRVRLGRLDEGATGAGAGAFALAEALDFGAARFVAAFFEGWAETSSSQSLRLRFLDILLSAGLEPFGAADSFGAS